MLRNFVNTATRTLCSTSVITTNKPVVPLFCRYMQIASNGHQSMMRKIPTLLSAVHHFRPSVLATNMLAQMPSLLGQVRTLTKFSLQRGKRKSVKAVIKRFYRLNWGIWIHTKCGRHKKMWKKSTARKKRLSQHVFCNATQSTLLDKMVTREWKRPRYFVDDPYTPYHSREEFPTTRRKPAPLSE